MMLRSRTFDSPGIERMVERQMRNWELARAQRLDVPEPQRGEVEDFITISRQVGVGATEVSLGLASSLNWPRFDRELLRAMAGNDEVRRRVYESMDERDVGWFENVYRSIADRTSDETGYFHRLTLTVLSLARQGSGVYLGRGVDLMLPRHLGFRVRLIGSFDWRGARFAERHDLPIKKAREEVKRIDHERAEFVRNHFDVDVEDPLRYDLTLNVERYSASQVVEVILAARFWLAASPRSDRAAKETRA
jgi:cytidylate kinase